jgi:hypothetical protein
MQFAAGIEQSHEAAHALVSHVKSFLDILAVEQPDRFIQRRGANSQLVRL